MIHGIAGAIGSGKSHLQLKIALEYCEMKEKQLVCNFPLNREALKEYCKLKKYNWCLRLLRMGGIIELHAPKKIDQLFFPESVVCLDEAGIFLNARDFQKTSKSLLSDLCQSRKFGSDLVWCAQFMEQVDKQFRELTQYWTHANSLTYYDKKFRRPKLLYKRYYWMDANAYNTWDKNYKARANHWRTRLAFSYRYEGGFLNEADKLLFNCFDSFTRIDHSVPYSRIETMYTCPIHKPNCKAVSNYGGSLPIMQIKPQFERLNQGYRLSGIKSDEPQNLNDIADDWDNGEYIDESQYEILINS